ncbi:MULTISPECIES: MarR family winged helix-turn-helix transcriptional regulator [unclassified Leifsonia]|uniref:MarR family winged helix-turn-helix transcriptional regulator n=1 Tax=unclassified Leifsonia TaxID=2663824 RepID=UPI001442E353|nr:MarR family transcriptional regulator [Leifsonia sp. PS1209]QIZ97659.1 winged helix DNA-binding protein [Leifsonia sp. PS1209]
MSSRSEQLTALIRTLSFAQRATADAWVRTSGLSRSQAFTLGYIEEHQENGVIARELSEMSGTTPASVASLLQGLEERGYITRTPSPDDSRVKLISVTPEGAEVVAGFQNDLAAEQERTFSVLDTEEQDRLIALLRRVTDTLDS